jgi:CheY-like chemotaxis protein
VGRALLTKRGWSVEIVADGQAALDALEEDRYDLVLMDVQMPIMDGLEATRRLRERGSTVPVVAITAHALDSERASCMEAGMDDFLTKPFTPEDLYDTVIRWARVPDDEPAAHVPHDDKGDAMSQEEGVPVHLEAFRAVMREAGIEEVVEPSISAFLDDAPSRMEELASALDAADPQRVAAVAHALKSGCRNLRADDLADLLEELERAGTGADMEAAGRLAETVRSEYHRVEAFLLRALDEG